MQFRELLELNKFAFGIDEMPSVKPVVGYNKIYLNDKNLENIFIFTGVPTLLKGHVGTNPNFAFYFDDYVCLADIRTVLGYVVPFIEFTMFAQVRLLTDSNGGALEFNNSDVTRKQLSVVAGEYDGVSDMTLGGIQLENNFTLVRGYWVEYSQRQNLVL